MAYNGNYSQQQIIDMLYYYMVKQTGTNAAGVCRGVFNMSEDEIKSRYKNTKDAYRILQPYYQSYGFERKYKAFRKINKGKLSNYVRTYWDQRASEGTLLDYFPEIRDEYYCEKAEYESKDHSWGSSSGEGVFDDSYKLNLDKEKVGRSSGGGAPAEAGGIIALIIVILIILYFVNRSGGCSGGCAGDGFFGSIISGILGLFEWIIGAIWSIVKWIWNAFWGLIGGIFSAIGSSC